MCPSLKFQSIVIISHPLKINLMIIFIVIDIYFYPGLFCRVQKEPVVPLVNQAGMAMT